MKRRHTPCNYAGDRRMIDVAFDLATREPSARRHDRFSKGEPVALRIGSVHAIKCDQVALGVAYSHAYDNVELPCLCNSSGNDCICFGQSQGHGTKSLVAFQAYLDIPHRSSQRATTGRDSYEQDVMRCRHLGVSKNGPSPHSYAAELRLLTGAKIRTFNIGC
jgi:hypothetical protein